jgi:hypothetical protein
MRSVLFVNAQTERLPDMVYPLGTAAVATALRDVGCKIRPLDLCFEADGRGPHVEALQLEDPCAPTLSSPNLDSSILPNPLSFSADYQASTVWDARPLKSLLLPVEAHAKTHRQRIVVSLTGRRKLNELRASREHPTQGQHCRLVGRGGLDA